VDCSPGEREDGGGRWVVARAGSLACVRDEPTRVGCRVSAVSCWRLLTHTLPLAHIVHSLLISPHFFSPTLSTASCGVWWSLPQLINVIAADLHSGDPQVCLTNWLCCGWPSEWSTQPRHQVSHTVDQAHRTKHLLEKFEFSQAPAWSSARLLVCVVVVGRHM
jgi:hypothetical protein